MYLSLGTRRQKQSARIFPKFAHFVYKFALRGVILKFNPPWGFAKNCRKNFNCIIPVQILYFSFIGRGFNPLPKRAIKNSFYNCETLYCTQCSTVLIQRIILKIQNCTANSTVFILTVQDLQICTEFDCKNNCCQNFYTVKIKNWNKWNWDF